MLCILGNGNIEPKSVPGTRGERKDPCKIGPELEASITKRETPQHRISVFANTPTTRLDNLKSCNTLHLICEAFCAAHKSRFCSSHTLPFFVCRKSSKTQDVPIHMRVLMSRHDPQHSLTAAAQKGRSVAILAQDSVVAKRNRFAPLRISPRRLGRADNWRAND